MQVFETHCKWTHSDEWISKFKDEVILHLAILTLGCTSRNTAFFCQPAWVCNGRKDCCMGHVRMQSPLKFHYSIAVCNSRGFMTLSSRYRYLEIARSFTTQSAYNESCRRRILQFYPHDFNVLYQRHKGFDDIWTPALSVAWKVIPLEREYWMIHQTVNLVWRCSHGATLDNKYCLPQEALQSGASFNYGYPLLRLQQAVIPLAIWPHAFFSACRSPDGRFHAQRPLWFLVMVRTGRDYPLKGAFSPRSGTEIF